MTDQDLDQPQVHKDRRDLHNLKRILPFLLEFRGRAMIALGCLILAKVANVGIPVILKEIIDYFESMNTQDILLALPISLLAGYGALKFMAALFNELRDVVFAKVRYRAMRRLSTSVLRHLHSLSLRFHLERKVGALSRDLERGTRSVSHILNHLAFSILPVLVEFALVAFILLSEYSWIYALAMFSSIIVYIIFTYFVTEWRMDFRHHMNEADSQSNSVAFDSLINFEMVKYFNNEKLELSRYDNSLSQWEYWAIKSQSSMSLLNFGQGAIIAISVTVVMIMATNSVIINEMTIGDLVLVNAFLLQLFIPLASLGVVYRQTKYALADMDLIFKLLDTKHEVIDHPNSKNLKIIDGKVTFKNVSFSYQNDRQILYNLSFEIPAGEKVAIVGHSGAGKSTITRLMYRFYDVNEGSIYIDGQDLRSITQESLHSSVGIVPQDTVLFNDSILYNIAYGKPDATFEDIKKAASMAHILGFIDKLPDQWNTIVGERGLKLSGGEKQRVSIARSILKNPHILIFDEATSSLDSKTERAILKTLNEVSSNTTTMVIAHRLSTIIDADTILVMKNGEIIERGTHSALYEANGHYRKMWDFQIENL